jgi:YesN/AraC family two-component response regulator
MNIRSFMLTYYESAGDYFHITRIIDPKENLTVHVHDYFQIVFLLQGNLIHHVENKSAMLSAGDVFILPPNLPHYVEKNSPSVDFYSLSFMPACFQSPKESNKLLLDFLYYLESASFEQIQAKVSLSYEDSRFTQLMLERIWEEFEGKKAGKMEIIKESTSVLLSLFARVYFEEKAEKLVTKENRQLVMHCAAYIRNHFDEDITLSEMARRSAMSKTGFCTMFSSIVGTSFKDFLNRVRIEKATEYLLAEEKIGNVAISCGYSDFSTFYRNFKKYRGISPSAFVKKMGRGREG